MKTALYDFHCALGGKMVEFCGWEMPIQYKGLIHEHHAVRQRVGLFDVSHMGRIFVEGPDAEALLNYLSTNQIAGKKEGTATYTVWCDETGGCVDDLIIYRLSPQKFFLVVNAGNREKDLDHLKAHAKAYDVTITDRYAEDGILALQGPLSEQLLQLLFPEVVKLKPMRFSSFSFDGQPLTIARTGYTGEQGFEIYAEHSLITKLWNLLLKQGEPLGIEPIGLGARDTLRMEMGYALYGHEIDATTAPTESVAAWTVKWDKPDFLGKKALMALEQSPAKRREYGIVLIDKGIAREGYEVFSNEKNIGKVTSGTQSPTLQQAIAIILVDRALQLGDIIEVQIRQNRCQARVVELPFRK